MAKKIARVAVPTLLIAAALGFVASQPHHRRCRVVPAYTPPSQYHLEHVAQAAPEGFRLISPSVNCGRCHDPKIHTVIP